MSASLVTHTFGEMDTDGNGWISRDEFTKWLGGLRGFSQARRASRAVTAGERSTKVGSDVDYLSHQIKKAQKKRKKKYKKENESALPSVAEEEVADVDEADGDAKQPSKQPKPDATATESTADAVTRELALDDVQHAQLPTDPIEPRGHVRLVVSSAPRTEGKSAMHCSIGDFFNDDAAEIESTARAADQGLVPNASVELSAPQQLQPQSQAMLVAEAMRAAVAGVAPSTSFEAVDEPSSAAAFTPAVPLRRLPLGTESVSPPVPATSPLTLTLSPVAPRNVEFLHTAHIDPDAELTQLKQELIGERHPIGIDALKPSMSSAPKVHWPSAHHKTAALDLMASFRQRDHDSSEVWAAVSPKRGTTGGRKPASMSVDFNDQLMKYLSAEYAAKLATQKKEEEIGRLLEHKARVFEREKTAEDADALLDRKPVYALTATAAVVATPPAAKRVSPEADAKVEKRRETTPPHSTHYEFIQSPDTSGVTPTLSSTRAIGIGAFWDDDVYSSPTSNGPFASAAAIANANVEEEEYVVSPRLTRTSPERSQEDQDWAAAATARAAKAAANAWAERKEKEARRDERLRAGVADLSMRSRWSTSALQPPQHHHQQHRSTTRTAVAPENEKRGGGAGPPPGFDPHRTVPAYESFIDPPRLQTHSPRQRPAATTMLMEARATLAQQQRANTAGGVPRQADGFAQRPRVRINRHGSIHIVAAEPLARLQQLATPQQQRDLTPILAPASARAAAPTRGPARRDTYFGSTTAPAAPRGLGGARTSSTSPPISPRVQIRVQGNGDPDSDYVANDAAAVRLLTAESPPGIPQIPTSVAAEWVAGSDSLRAGVTGGARLLALAQEVQVSAPLPESEPLHLPQGQRIHIDRNGHVFVEPAVAGAVAVARGDARAAIREASDAAEVAAQIAEEDARAAEVKHARWREAAANAELGERARTLAEAWGGVRLAPSVYEWY